MEIDELIKIIKYKDISLYKECLKTIEKTQFHYDLDSWDECNLGMMEEIFQKIVEFLDEHR